MKRLFTISVFAFFFSINYHNFSLVGTSCNAQYTALLNFDFTNGAGARGSLTLTGKVLYGMTLDGGVGAGTIFSIDTNGGNYKDLLNFNNTNGESPYGNLTILRNKLYGMTALGGVYNQGVIFSIDTNGAGYRDLQNFNGGAPAGSLTYSSGVLFGMTSNGGALHDGYIFSIDTNGSNFKILLNFNGSNGASPTGSLIYISGVLYGMTFDGGANNEGCIFSIDTDGSNYKDMLDFNGTNGKYPEGSLIYKSGMLYGMAYGGGANGVGLIFSIDTNGNKYKDLFDFNGTNGLGPIGSLTLSGNLLFGMTNDGGIKYDSGCIFYIDTNGSRFRELFNFNGTNGSNPNGDLTLSGSVLYGMTALGGANGDGVIFKLDTTNIDASINELSTISGGVKVYPNPNNGVFSIVFSYPPSGISQTIINIYNVLGEKVYDANLRPKTTPIGGLGIIDLSIQPSGVYIFRVLSEDGGLIGEGKLIIQK